MSELTKSDVINLLKKLNDPGFNQDRLMLNSIKKFDTTGNKLDLEIDVTGKEKTEQELERLIKSEIKDEFKDLKEVNVKVAGKSESNVSTHEDPKKEAVLPGVKNTIAVASGKGGVGKSTVAVNLAVALAKKGAKVGLLDADIYGPSIPLMLGIDEKPKVMQTDKGMRILPLEKYGIKVISIGLLVDDKAPVIWRGPMASGAIKQFMSDVDWGELDYLVFDLPPGTGDIQLTLVQTIPLTGAVIVTTPQEVSLIDARKALKMFGRVNVPVLGVVENMSYFIAPDTDKKYDIFGSGGGANLSKELETPYLGGIPINPEIREGGDSGVPIVEGNEESEEAKSIMQIAGKLGEQVEIRNSQRKDKVEILLGDDD